MPHKHALNGSVGFTDRHLQCLSYMYHPDCLQLSVGIYVWVAWKSSGNGMMLVYRCVYAVYRVRSEYRESEYGK